jgi:hypothetical protein
LFDAKFVKNNSGFFRRVLEFNACLDITDIGVKGLCDGATRNLGSGGDGLGVPKSLLKLGSSGTKITNAGIQIILENFHSLQVWDMATVQTFAGIPKEFFLNQNLEIPKYSLLSLRIAPPYCDVYIPKTLGFVVSLCPSVIQVEIYNYKGLTDSDLLSLLSLKNLRNFKMSGFSSNGNVTFGGGVTPILKAFGNSSLKELSLHRLSDVNIQVITQLCPNLHSLELKDNLSYFTAKLVKEWVKTEPTEPLVLKQLERLRVVGSGIPREHLILLLSLPLLVEITIGRCSTFDDDILQKVARIQTFSNLEELRIKLCHTVTEKGIDIFMNAQNPLKKIWIDRCDEISKSNVECWERLAKKNNWQLLIEFFFYFE